MLHVRKCWIPLQEVQLQENPWQKSLISLWIIFSWLVTCCTQYSRVGEPGNKLKNFYLFADDLFGTVDSQSGSCIEVGQQKAIDGVEEISVERNTQKIFTVPCNAFKDK